jgi:hypothetical protein
MLNIAAQQVRLSLGDAHPIKESSVKIMRYLMPIYFVVAGLACFIVFGFLAGDPQNDQVYGSLHYLSCFVAIALVAFNVEFHTVPLIKQVEQLKVADAENPGIDSALTLLRRTVWENRVNATIQSTINLLMGAVPLLLRKVSYQMPLAWFFIALGCIDNFRHLGVPTNASSKSGSRRSKDVDVESKKVADVTQVAATLGVSTYGPQ